MGKKPQEEVPHQMEGISRANVGTGRRIRSHSHTGHLGMQPARKRGYYYGLDPKRDLAQDLIMPSQYK